MRKDELAWGGPGCAPEEFKGIARHEGIMRIRGVNTRRKDAAGTAGRGTDEMPG